jgi:hypothetical protein
MLLSYVAVSEADDAAVFRPRNTNRCPRRRLTSRFSGRTLCNGCWHFIPHGPLQPVVRRLASARISHDVAHHEIASRAATSETQALGDTRSDADEQCAIAIVERV